MRVGAGGQALYVLRLLLELCSGHLTAKLYLCGFAKLDPGDFECARSNGGPVQHCAAY